MSITIDNDVTQTLSADRPKKRWLYLEPSRTLGELAAWPISKQFLKLAPKGDGHPVIALPGFMAGDGSTGILRNFLSSRGYAALPWELGRNLGPHVLGEEFVHLETYLEDVVREHGQKVSLVGWSLGGVFSREIAKQRPDLIRQVITLGSPFAGNPESSNAWQLFKYIAGDIRDDEHLNSMRARLSQAPEGIPSTAIYTKTDGIVHWSGAREHPGPLTDNIEVLTSHCGLGFNASTLYAVADRLAQPEDDWKPFHRKGWRSTIYPSSGHD